MQWPVDGFVKANLNQTGFYRVNYELSDWSKITAYLKTNIGSPGIVRFPLHEHTLYSCSTFLVSKRRGCGGWVGVVLYLCDLGSNLEHSMIISS